MADDPYAKVIWDGKTLDRITAEALHEAEDILGYDLTVVQGSYNPSKVAASAGTHDAGGAVDLLPFDADRKVRALRQIGFAAWHRLPSEGDWAEHVHAVLIGNKFLSPAAGRQVEAYKAGRNGLKSNLLDPTWRPSPIPVFRWPVRTWTPVRHRIVSANLFVRSDHQVANANRIIAATRAAFGPLRLPPDAIAVQEARPAQLAKVEGYRVFRAGEGEAALHLAVLLRDGLEFLGTEFHDVVPGTGEGVLDHPRGVLVVKYRKRGRRVALVVGHAPVFGEARMTAGDEPGEAALQHATYSTAVVRIAERLRRHGFLVFVCADANSRGHWNRSLPVALANAGLHVTRDGVDVIASDPARVGPPEVELVPLGKPGTPEAAHEAVAIRTTERKRS